jgi:hypothetical protein
LHHGDSAARNEVSELHVELGGVILADVSSVD